MRALQTRGPQTLHTRRYEATQRQASKVKPTWSRLETVAVKAASISVPVAISVKYKVEFGESLRLVGNQSFLGNWDPRKGADMSWTEGNIWKADARVPVGTEVNFKVVRVKPDGGEAVWEDGDNRSFKILGPDYGLNITCHWSRGGDMKVDAYRLGAAAEGAAGKGGQHQQLTAGVAGAANGRGNGVSSAAAAAAVPALATSLASADGDGNGRSPSSSFSFSPSSPSLDDASLPNRPAWVGPDPEFLRSRRPAEAERGRGAGAVWRTEGLSGVELELVRGDAEAPSWLKKLSLQKRLLVDAPPACRPRLPELAAVYVYATWVGNGALPCAEAGSHYRPNHHANLALQMFRSLEWVIGDAASAASTHGSGLPTSASPRGRGLPARAAATAITGTATGATAAPVSLLVRPRSSPPPLAGTLGRRSPSPLPRVAPTAPRPPALALPSELLPAALPPAQRSGVPGGQGQSGGQEEVEHEQRNMLNGDGEGEGFHAMEGSAEEARMSPLDAELMLPPSLLFPSTSPSSPSLLRPPTSASKTPQTPVSPLTAAAAAASVLTAAAAAATGSSTASPPTSRLALSSFARPPSPRQPVAVAMPVPPLREAEEPAGMAELSRQISDLHDLMANLIASLPNVVLQQPPQLPMTPPQQPPPPRQQQEVRQTSAECPVAAATAAARVQPLQQTPSPQQWRRPLPEPQQQPCQQQRQQQQSSPAVETPPVSCPSHLTSPSPDRRKSLPRHVTPLDLDRTASTSTASASSPSDGVVQVALGPRQHSAPPQALRLQDMQAKDGFISRLGSRDVGGNACKVVSGSANCVLLGTQSPRTPSGAAANRYGTPPAAALADAAAAKPPSADHPTNTVSGGVARIPRHRSTSGGGSGVSEGIRPRSISGGGGGRNGTSTAASAAVHASGRTVFVAAADVGLQRGIRTNSSGVASTLAGAQPTAVPSIAEGASSSSSSLPPPRPATSAFSSSSLRPAVVDGLHQQQQRLRRVSGFTGRQGLAGTRQPLAHSSLSTRGSALPSTVVPASSTTAAATSILARLRSSSAGGSAVGCGGGHGSGINSSGSGAAASASVSGNNTTQGCCRAGSGNLSVATGGATGGASSSSNSSGNAGMSSGAQRPAVLGDDPAFIAARQAYDRTWRACQYDSSESRWALRLLGQDAGAAATASLLKAAAATSRTLAAAAAATAAARSESTSPSRSTAAAATTAASGGLTQHDTVSAAAAATAAAAKDGMASANGAAAATTAASHAVTINTSSSVSAGGCTGVGSSVGFGSWCPAGRRVQLQERAVDAAVGALEELFTAHKAPLGLLKVAPFTYHLTNGPSTSSSAATASFTPTCSSANGSSNASGNASSSSGYCNGGNSGSSNSGTGFVTSSRRLHLKLLPDGRLAVNRGGGCEELTAALARLPLPPPPQQQQQQQQTIQAAAPQQPTQQQRQQQQQREAAQRGGLGGGRSEATRLAAVYTASVAAPVLAVAATVATGSGSSSGKNGNTSGFSNGSGGKGMTTAAAVAEGNAVKAACDGAAQVQMAAA